MHHQLLPDNVFVEDWSAHGIDFNFPQKQIQGLQKRGHNVTTFPWGAVVQVLPLSTSACRLSPRSLLLTRAVCTVDTRSPPI